MKHLDGKVALVTGASRGIGREIALTLAREGAHVFINYNSSAAGAEAVAAAIVEQGGKANIVQGNVADAADAQALVDATKEFGHLDILVNNAGITRDKLLMRMSSEDWQAVIDTNLTGAFNMTKAAMRPLMKKRAGSIINITSIVGIKGQAGQANYSAAKAGMIGFTKSIAREVASRNICVNAVAPGAIQTDMLGATPEKAIEEMKKAIPLGRIGQPSDIAEMVAFLASDRARYITGQVLAVDGGYTT